MNFNRRYILLIILFITGILLDQKMSFLHSFGPTEFLFNMRLFVKYTVRLIVWSVSIMLIFWKFNFKFSKEKVLYSLLILILLLISVHYAMFAMIYLINYGILDYYMLMDWMTFIFAVIISRIFLIE